MNRTDLLQELAEFAALSANWDGEQASAPNPASMRIAEAVIRLLTGEVGVELLSNGNAGLHLHDGAAIADVEFWPNMVALYAECGGLRFKGSISVVEER